MQKESTVLLPQKLAFITTNAKKILSLKEVFANLGLVIEVENVAMELTEQQCSSVREVSLSKAQQAYEKLKRPLIVEDGGFEIRALQGFPGVYTKYILETIGTPGILKLMEGCQDRQCRFASTTTFVDEGGNMHAFDRLGGYGEIALKRSEIQSPFAWSDFWSIYWVPSLQKMLCELNKEELFSIWNAADQKTSQTVFAEWLCQAKNGRRSSES